jgi:uncharacterized protein (TIGR02268 family)
MQNQLLLQSTLLLLLAASAAAAKVREPVERTLILSEHPRSEAPQVYVGGRISTVLRLETPCDATRTQLLGWEGHFEPLICSGKSVVLYPLRDLTPKDRFLLQVTLTDGTELPFIVTAHRQFYEDREIDQQVNVFADRQGYDAVLASLYRALKSERELLEENALYRKEANSVDHAYATLLANGEMKQVPFRPKRTMILESEGMDMVVRTFSGKGKAAAVIQLANTRSEEPWKFKEARLSSDLTSHTAKAFALRMSQTKIVPGATGRMAIVVDKSAFSSEQGLVDLTLEIFREDGMQQVLVSLDHQLTQE